MDWTQIFMISLYHGYIPQILIAEFLFTMGLQRRDRFWLRFGIGLPVFAVLSVLIPNIISMFVSGFFSLTIFLLSVVFFCSIYKNRFTDILFCCISAQLTQNISYNVEGVIEILLGLADSYVAQLFVSVVCMAVVYTVCYFVFARKGKDEIRVESRYVFTLAVIAAVFVYLMQFLLQVYGLDDYWVTRLPLIVCCVFGLWLQHGLQTIRDEQLENEKLEYYLAQEREQFETIKDSIDLINMKAHDMKHQILRLQQGGNAEGMDEVMKIIDDYDSTVECGNATLDVILTQKQYRCDRDGIGLSMIVQGEVFDFLSSSDIASVFGNIMDNAIECEEGTEPVSRRYIHLRAVRKGGTAVIHCENFCDRKVEMRNGLPVNEEKDKNFHGYGMKSVRYVTKKNGGVLHVTQDDNIFSVNIAIPIPAATGSLEGGEEAQND